MAASTLYLGEFANHSSSLMGLPPLCTVSPIRQCYHFPSLESIPSPRDWRFRTNCMSPRPTRIPDRKYYKESRTTTMSSFRPSIAVCPTLPIVLTICHNIAPDCQRDIKRPIDLNTGGGIYPLTLRLFDASGMWTFPFASCHYRLSFSLLLFSLMFHSSSHPCIY
jgi:hypothetical protein